jgi:hypothetical protein
MTYLDEDKKELWNWFMVNGVTLQIPRH